MHPSNLKVKKKVICLVLNEYFTNHVSYVGTKRSQEAGNDLLRWFKVVFKWCHCTNLTFTFPKKVYFTVPN